jgi:tetratricopeptide (TPR) repeat protein
VASIRLSADAHKALLGQYHRAAVPEVRLRAHILLLLDAGYPWATISAVLFCSVSTISRWKRRYEQEGVNAVVGRPCGRRPSGVHIWASLVVRWVLTLSPTQFQFARSRWSCEAAAAEELVDVIRGEEKLMEEYPNVAFYREAVAAAYLGRGELLLLLGQPEAAAAELTKSLAVSRELLDKFGVLSASMLVRGQTFLALGRARAAAGKPAGAAEEWTKAAKVFELALKIDPDNLHHRRGFAEAERALKPAAK